MRLIRALIRERSGAAAVEFGFVLPFLAVLLLGTIKAGVVYNNYISLTNAVAAGAHQLAISRGTSNAYTQTLNAMHVAGPNLQSFGSPISGQSVTVRVAGSSCDSGNEGGTCMDAFVAGADATVTASYPCDFDVILVSIPNCTMTSTATEYVQ